MRGAEDVPISSTLGIEEGMGVVSMRTCWLNLRSEREVSGEVQLLWITRAHLGSLAAILAVLGCRNGFGRARWCFGLGA